MVSVRSVVVSVPPWVSVGVVREPSVSGRAVPWRSAPAAGADGAVGEAARPDDWSGSRSDDELMSRPLPGTAGFDAAGPGEVGEGVREGRPVAMPQGGVAGRRHGGTLGAGAGDAPRPGMSAPTARNPCAGVASPVVGSSRGAAKGPDAGCAMGPGEAKGPEGATAPGAGNGPDDGAAPGIGNGPDDGPAAWGVGKGPVVGPCGRASGGGGGPISTSSAEPQPRRRRRHEPDEGPVVTSVRAASGRPSCRGSYRGGYAGCGSLSNAGVSAPSEPAAGPSPVVSRSASGACSRPASARLERRPDRHHLPNALTRTQRSDRIDAREVGPHGASGVAP